MHQDLAALEARLWDAADELRANSGLKASEYGSPVLGLIFLRFADARFEAARGRIEAKASARRKIGPSEFQAEGLIYLDPEARFEVLLRKPEGSNIGQAVNDAMSLVERDNPDLAGVLPRNYSSLPSSTLASLLRHIKSYTKDLEGDAFGLVYEYFLGKFALAEGQGAGEFFTPMSIVRLIVEIIEPYHGRIFDPACGSGGMFVQSAHFVERHRKSPGEELSVFGQEKTTDTVKLAKMNLAVHGLSGDIREANSYYEDPFDSQDRFDFVMANPPFNVDRIDKAKMEGDERLPDLSKAGNGNYIWIQLFANSLNEHGRAGFVMVNSAADALHSEAEIRKGLVEEGLVDAMIAVGPNFFYTVPLSVTIWILDKGKRGTDRADKVLFLDARRIFRQLDRTHRDFTDEQLEFLSGVVRLYRDEPEDVNAKGNRLLAEQFPDGEYADVQALCRIASVAEIAAENWSLAPGRYVGAEVEELEDEVFEERLAASRAELLNLGSETRDLEARVDEVLERLGSSPAVSGP